MKRDEATRIRYISSWVNNSHHILVVIFCFYSIAIACSPKSNWPIPGVNNYFAFFYNDQCFV